MNEMITISARTVDEAITKASIELGVISDKLEYTVVEKGSLGLFGVIGVKPAIIKAKKKDIDEIKSESQKENYPVEKIVKDTEKKEIQKEIQKEEHSVNVSGCKKVAEEFLNSIFNVMCMEVSLMSTFNEKERELSIEMSGDSMGVLIGKRGQTLDSLQYLVSLAVNKHFGDYIRIKLDTENYRARRKETLEVLAKNVAYKVKRTKKSVSLEPMNPYERRVIHSALQNDKYIVTRSEGQEPYRHIVISLKRENRN